MLRRCPRIAVLLACAVVVAVVVSRAIPGLPDARSNRKMVAASVSLDTFRSVLIADVPHIRQKPDFCGEACGAMYLRKLGQPADQDYVFDCSALDPLEGRGCYTKELVSALKHIGFQVGSVWYRIPAAEGNRDRALLDQWKALHADLVAGVPSIVCMHYDDRPKTTEHFRLILGYDADADEVIYHEPAEARGAYQRMKRSALLELWPLKYETHTWTLIRMPLKPGQLRQGQTATTFTAADYAQHMMQLKPRIPGAEFVVIVQPPFMVIGDESAEMVRRRAESTVQWAVDKLKWAYFSKDPSEILDIWLFKDAASYRQHARLLFGSEPHTPYGYFSSTHKALVMNIATGGGTLVHEIVHPFMAANFPDCPAWFNEGLGSLYEQSHEVDGQIRGLTNWRLHGLQEAIRSKQVPTFRALCSTTDHQFYAEDRGTNYAQARYLCYYLQERGLLRDFYHRFHANRENDPTGFHTLQTLLGTDDMIAFQESWEAYVLRLRFP